MQYTAIIKDGGLFIPNVFSDLDGGHAHIVQVEVDIESVRQQLNLHADPKTQAPKELKKQVKKQPKKEPQAVNLAALRKSAGDELEALDDGELSEIFKAYMNEGQAPTQISLENL